MSRPLRLEFPGAIYHITSRGDRREESWGQVLPFASERQTIHPMSRPLRLEFPGAIYHITSRGDRREAIYRDDDDRLAQLSVIEQAMDRFDAQVLAYCLMGNHYHLVLHTRQANLSRLMRHLNGVYTQRFNRRHGLVGHLFQGRFKAILVDRDAYLLNLCRYVDRNPVAAGLVRQAGEWPWSSYRAHVCRVPTAPWLDTAGLHGYLLGKTPLDAAATRRAATLYAALVDDSNIAPIWETGLRAQVFLGDEQFVARMQALATAAQSRSPDIPKVQRRSPLTLTQCLDRCGDRADAIRMAHAEGGVSMTTLASELGLSVSRVSRLIAGAEAKGKT